MKKKIVFMIINLMIIVLLVKIFDSNLKLKKTAEIEAKAYDYKEYNDIRLLHVDSGIVEKVKLDKYLYGVVAAEMPVDFDKEALKAQAIVARTYTIYQIKNSKKHDNADLCDNSLCCQAWISKKDRFDKWENEKCESNWKKIVDSVEDTKGKIITYNDEPIDAFFHSNSGGKTELSINVWGGDLPYLQTVETQGEENYTSYSSEVEFSKEDFIKKLKEKYSDFKIDFEKEDCIKINSYTESGRVKNIKIGNKNLSGMETRLLLNLKSTNFEVSLKNDSIKFFVKGYGHGVGLSQCASDTMAKNGYKAEDIIKYFYKNVEISE